MLKLMVFLLIAAFAGLFFVNGPDGSPVLTLDDFKPDMPEMESAPAQPAKVTKWKDENGVWQFSDRPEDAVLGETIELDGDINTMPATDTSILSQSSGTTSNSASRDKAGISLPSGLTTVSGDQAQQMMDTVTDLQGTVDDRKAELDKLTGQP